MAFGIYTIAHYRLDSVKYAAGSASWYLSVQAVAVLITAVAAIFLIAMSVVRKKQQRA